MRNKNKKSKPKIIVVMPAYNAAKTLKMTYEALPHDRIDRVILVDDGSTDETIQVAKELGLSIFMHTKNYGYGANQKTCYTEALKENADIIVMVHPDYQYDPTLVPQIIAPIESGEADIVLGSRFLKGSAWKMGMPWWKYVANRFLTKVENIVLGLKLSEYHTGYRAYNRKFLEEVAFLINSDKFVFDQDILVQAAHNKYRIKEVPVPVKYFPEASSASFYDSVIYGFNILFLLFRYLLHKFHIIRQGQFEIFTARYKQIK